MAEKKGRLHLHKEIITKAWKDKEFKEKLHKEPAGTLKEEFGIELPEGVKVEVLLEKKDHLYLVIPESPKGGDKELSEEEIDAISGGGSIYAMRTCDNGC